MKRFLYQVLINYKREVFRNPMFYGFALFMPVAFYVLFTKMINLGIPKSALPAFHLSYLITMAVYSALMSSVISVANTLLDDREHNFTLFVELSPKSRVGYYLGMLLVFLPLNALIVVVIALVGILVNGVNISFTMWLILLLLLPLLSIPLIMIGILVSLAGPSNVVNGVAQLVTLPMALLSGLWFPIESFPEWMQRIGHRLPPYQISTIIQETVDKENLEMANVFGLALWTLGLAAAMVLVFRYIRRHELLTI
ncbi:MAG: ABC transporter permease [Streptococcaceae bacterium]|jgi:ABC-2 type transport system permease protein|nr:ABC transporter permease [Streptococcaceae bacterium]